MNLASRFLRPGLATAACLLAACTSDLPAPDNFMTGPGSSGGDTGVPGDLQVDCSMAALGAVDANYDFAPQASGGMAPYTWSAMGLDPLSIDSLTGAITGVPTAEGTITAEVTVQDSAGASASATCEITVRPKIGSSIPDSKAMPCVVAGETLNDFLVPDTGDATAITCATPGGTGNGKMPAGITVNPETCAIEGSITEDRYGTWVWMVEGDQNGAKTYLPYCATNMDPAPGSYAILATHGGDTMTNKALVPARGTFQPGTPVTFGDPPGEDPRFEITDPICGNPCFFGFNFFINASPFDTFSLNPAELLKDNNGQNQGFFHHMSAQGPAVPAQFEGRPWVLNVALDYCLTQTDGNCAADMVKANGNANLEFAIVMFPG